MGPYVLEQFGFKIPILTQKNLNSKSKSSQIWAFAMYLEIKKIPNF